MPPCGLVRDTLGDSRALGGGAPTGAGERPRASLRRALLGDLAAPPAWPVRRGGTEPRAGCGMQKPVGPAHADGHTYARTTHRDADACARGYDERTGLPNSNTCADAHAASYGDTHTEASPNSYGYPASHAYTAAHGYAGSVRHRDGISGGACCPRTSERRANLDRVELGVRRHLRGLFRYCVGRH